MLPATLVGCWVIPLCCSNSPHNIIITTTWWRSSKWWMSNDKRDYQRIWIHAGTRVLMHDLINRMNTYIFACVGLTSFALILRSLQRYPLTLGPYCSGDKPITYLLVFKIITSQWFKACFACIICHASTFDTRSWYCLSFHSYL